VGKFLTILATIKCWRRIT